MRFLDLCNFLFDSFSLCLQSSILFLSCCSLTFQEFSLFSKNFDLSLDLICLQLGLLDFGKKFLRLEFLGLLLRLDSLRLNPGLFFGRSNLFRLDLLAFYSSCLMCRSNLFSLNFVSFFSRLFFCFSKNLLSQPLSFNASFLKSLSNYFSLLLLRVLSNLGKISLDTLNFRLLFVIKGF